MLYDVFICHASEDKDSFVRPLAKELRKAHLEVWYDEFSLNVGDSLRESIDKGLAKSRYGIVVLSPAFFIKKWPQRELNGLVAREMSESNSVILPIWHNISIKEILKYSPPLADRKAVESWRGLKFVSKELLRTLRPKESPLIVARDELIHYGITPPVVTDEWWLDVVEATNRIPDYGAVPPPNTTWGRWTFPLPNPESHGEARGVRLAWTAMQLQWEKRADEDKITQITKPEIVLNFIASQPGLLEICHDYPAILATYAPQLTIRGFSGEFEDDFDHLSSKPQFSEEITLRLPNFGGYKPSSVACQFVQGDIFGPHPKFYDHFEYTVWFLSADSAWLPQKIHSYLVQGMKDWCVWQSCKQEVYEIARPFLDSLYNTQNYKTYKYTRNAKNSLLNWISESLKTLCLNDNSKDISDKFFDYGFIKTYFEKQRERNRKKS